jgi:hypothetical protein
VLAEVEDVDEVEVEGDEAEEEEDEEEVEGDETEEVEEEVVEVVGWNCCRAARSGARSHLGQRIKLHKEREGGMITTNVQTTGRTDR